MPASAVGAFIDVQTAFAATLAPGKVLLCLGTRGVAVLRVAGFVALRGIVLAAAAARRESSRANASSSELKSPSESKSLNAALNWAFSFAHDDRFFFDAIFRPQSSSCCCHHLTRQTPRKGANNSKKSLMYVI